MLENRPFSTPSPRAGEGRVRGQCFLVVFFLLFSLLPSSLHADSTGMGVLIMSDNRSREWTKLVRKTVRSANLPCPYEIFFGNADSSSQFAELRTYIRDLEDEGVTTVVVVPLITSPYGPAFKQWRYL